MLLRHDAGPVPAAALPSDAPCHASRRPSCLIAALVTAGLALAAPHTAAAQQVLRGTVVDSARGDAVAGAYVTALDSAGKNVAGTVTEVDGGFQLSLPAGGTYRLQASRIGYATFTTVPLNSDDVAGATLELRLTPDPVPIPGVAAEGKARSPFLTQVGFYDRQARHVGYFFTREDIDNARPQRITDVLRRVPGVRIAHTRDPTGASEALMPGAKSTFINMGKGGTCVPTVALDGVVIRAGGIPPEDSGPYGPPSVDQLVNPFNVEALEVYPTAAGLPPQFAGYLSPCGAILAWSRR